MSKHPFVAALLLVLTAYTAVGSSVDRPSLGPAPGIALLPSGKMVRSDHLMVKWRKEANVDQRLRAYFESKASLVRTIPQIGWDVIQVPERDLFKIKDALSQCRDVERCDFSGAYKPALIPNDPYYPSMWAPPRIQADRAWDITIGSASVVIAILDTGLDVNHIDLATNIWTNPGEIPGNSIDDDGNGYVDDVHGYDFTYDDPDPNDVYGHGTGCAGIAAAAINNSEGVVGIGPGCQLMACKCSRDDGYFFDDAVAPAFVYAADMGANVTSNSYFGDGITPAQMDAINYAYAQGVLSVVAAGNDDRVNIYYPAGYDVALAVGALEPNDTKSWFSNYGSWVDVIAPGNSLLTTQVGNGYMGFAGTSGACPHVSGLAGLVFSMHPDWTPDQVREQIERASSPLLDPVIGPFTNYGVIDCRRALTGLALPSSGRPEILWTSPLAAQAGATICVRGKSLGTDLGEVRIGGTSCSVTSWTNDKVYATIPSISLHRHLEVTGAHGIATFPSFAVLDPGEAPLYGATDISIRGNYSAGSRLLGGFEEMRKSDGNVASGNAQFDGVASMDVIFQKLLTPLSDRIELTYVRKYDAANPGATETLYLYNFDTASYPYGSYVQIANLPITPGITQSDAIVVTDTPERFRSYETNVFLSIGASTASAYATFTIDELTMTAK